MIKGGLLKARRVGTQIRFTREDIQTAMIVRSAPSAGSYAELETLIEPSWARGYIRGWRQQLAKLLASSDPTKVIVNDRRGAKMFAILNPGNFVWGENLWHSFALKALSDRQVTKIFAGHRAVVFDEMIQHGRQIHELRERLERLDIPTSTICLLRRRSFFLSGKLLDQNIMAIEDLDDTDFRATAALISRLLARRNSPLNVEHLMVSGVHVNKGQELSEMARALEAFGNCEVIWSSNPDDDNSLEALTLDRPQFFDATQLQLPGDLTYSFDGAFKIRFYYESVSKKIATTFFAFPTITGNVDAWRSQITNTCRRFDDTGDIDLPAPRTTEFTRLVQLAYRDLCFEICLVVLRQAIEAGVFSAINVQQLEPPPINQLVATFGSDRAHTVAQSTHDSILLGRAARLFKAPYVPLSTNVSERPSVEIFAPLLDCRERLAEVVPNHNGPNVIHDSALTYKAIMEACSPIAESSISVALDHEIDIGTVHSNERVILRDDLITVSRVYLKGEHDHTDQIG